MSAQTGQTAAAGDDAPLAAQFAALLEAASEQRQLNHQLVGKLDAAVATIRTLVGLLIHAGVDRDTLTWLMGREIAALKPGETQTPYAGMLRVLQQDLEEGRPPSQQSVH